MASQCPCIRSYGRATHQNLLRDDRNHLLTVIGSLDAGDATISIFSHHEALYERLNDGDAMLLEAMLPTALLTREQKVLYLVRHNDVRWIQYCDNDISHDNIKPFDQFISALRGVRANFVLSEELGQQVIDAGDQVNEVCMRVRAPVALLTPQVLISGVLALNSLMPIQIIAPICMSRRNRFRDDQYEPSPGFVACFGPEIMDCDSRFDASARFVQRRLGHPDVEFVVYRCLPGERLYFWSIMCEGGYLTFERAPTSDLARVMRILLALPWEVRGLAAMIIASSFAGSPYLLGTTVATHAYHREIIFFMALNELA